MASVNALPELSLTPKEQEVFNLLIQGYKQSTIAEMLVVEYPTVKTHVKSIYQKRGVPGDSPDRSPASLLIIQEYERQLDELWEVIKYYANGRNFRVGGSDRDYVVEMYEYDPKLGRRDISHIGELARNKLAERRP